MSEEHTSAHVDHNEARRSVMEALDAEHKSQIAAHNGHKEAHNAALVILECKMQAQVAALQVKQDAMGGADAPLA